MTTTTENAFHTANIVPLVNRKFFAELPPADTRRWVPKRKAQVVAAVRAGAISLEEACDRYALTEEEFLTWQRAIDKFGLAGLRATRAQEYRGIR
jgi:hypothetical protein